jgi:hypothetical protein
MSDVILVVLGRAETARGLLHAAADFKHLLPTARINVLAVAEPVHISALGAEALVAEADAVARQQDVEHTRVSALQRVYEQWLAEIGSAAHDIRWIEAEGTPASVVGERGSRADIVVVGQPRDEDSRGRQLFRAALFGTDRPVLMVPAEWQGRLGRCVAIAWRDDRPAVRALIPALRCLAAAEQVHVLAEALAMAVLVAAQRHHRRAARVEARRASVTHNGRRKRIAWGSRMLNRLGFHWGSPPGLVPAKKIAGLV